MARSTYSRILCSGTKLMISSFSFRMAMVSMSAIGSSLRTTVRQLTLSCRKARSARSTTLAATTSGPTSMSSRLSCASSARARKTSSMSRTARGMIAAMLSTRPRFARSLAGSRRRGSRMASRQRSNGIWKTAAGGRISSVGCVFCKMESIKI